jgi:hypothetical protein
MVSGNVYRFKDLILYKVTVSNGNELLVFPATVTRDYSCVSREIMLYFCMIK